MTRLIDADEIVYEETLRCIGRIGNCSTYYHDYHVWVGDIDKMPTVEAMPIEWLKKFRNGLDSLSECKLIEAIDTIIDAYKAERKEE